MVHPPQAVIAIHVLLYFFDSLPLAHLVFSIICHIVYLQNFTPAWPLVSLSSLTFISSCLLVVADHFMWFFYFSRLTSQARSARGRMYRGPNSAIPGFSDIATFFAVCVWLAPLFLFLSLSAGENTLPTASGKWVSRCVGNTAIDIECREFHRSRWCAKYPIQPIENTSPPSSEFSLQNLRRCIAPGSPSAHASSSEPKFFRGNNRTSQVAIHPSRWTTVAIYEGSERPPSISRNPSPLIRYVVSGLPTGPAPTAGIQSLYGGWIGQRQSEYKKGYYAS